MKVVITSKNPVKKKATLIGFTALFPSSTIEIIEISVPSGVSEQPKSEKETLQGAQQRVENARNSFPDADYWVGIEGGIEEKKGEMEAFAWVFILDKKGKTGKGRTGTFFLPQAITDLINQGIELGIADDRVFGKTNSKQKEGTVGTLTHNSIDRTEYYRHAVTFALIPFLNPSLY
jgi:inosine/xanthosine triphosphatase